MVHPHRGSLRAQAIPRRGICIWRKSKQAPGCQVNTSSIIRAFLYSSPASDQHCNDHDSSGGMRKSGYHVDDSGDASNTEIGHLPAFSNQYRYHTTCLTLANLGFVRRRGNLGKDSREVPDGPSVRTAARAMPNLACVTG